jgi:hypothetical protein
MHLIDEYMVNEYINVKNMIAVINNKHQTCYAHNLEIHEEIYGIIALP